MLTASNLSSIMRGLFSKHIAGEQVTKLTEAVRACYVIEHKQIYADINNDTNGGNNNGTLGSYKNISECGLERGFSWNDSSGLRSDDSMDSVYTYCGGSSEVFWKTLNVI